jgi:hypothetical protein
MELVPVISDLQVPYHDRRAVDAMAQLIEAIKPKRVLCVGDVLDQPQVSQWTKGRAGEYAGDLAADRDKAVEVMAALKITDLSRSNHDDRIEKYVNQYAPGLSGLPELSIEKFMGLDDLGIRFHRKPAKVAPGWVMIHGDEVGSSRIAGCTALGAARKIGASVVCGHTHKLGLVHDHSAVSGRTTARRWGFEVGNVMNMTKAGYLGAGYANWQQGMGMLLIDGPDVVPMPISITKGSLWWDGVKYSG